MITEPGQVPALGPERALVPVRAPVQVQVQEQALRAPAQPVRAPEPAS
ncbi:MULTISPECIES: hypothetical protein [unclassified Mesorhizobium]|nr:MULTISPECIES: hypothetical protein [unclassified Mesorhizobium]